MIAEAAAAEAAAHPWRGDGTGEFPAGSMWPWMRWVVSRGAATRFDIDEWTAAETTDLGYRVQSFFDEPPMDSSTAELFAKVEGIWKHTPLAYLEGTMANWEDFWARAYFEEFSHGATSVVRNNAVLTLLPLLYPCHNTTQAQRWRIAKLIHGDPWVAQFMSLAVPAAAPRSLLTQIQAVADPATAQWHYNILPLRTDFEGTAGNFDSDGEELDDDDPFDEEARLRAEPIEDRAGLIFFEVPDLIDSDGTEKPPAEDAVDMELFERAMKTVPRAVWGDALGRCFRATGDYPGADLVLNWLANISGADGDAIQTVYELKGIIRRNAILMMSWIYNQHLFLKPGLMDIQAMRFVHDSPGMAIPFELKAQIMAQRMLDSGIYRESHYNTEVDDLALKLRGSSLGDPHHAFQQRFFASMGGVRRRVAISHADEAEAARHISRAGEAALRRFQGPLATARAAEGKEEDDDYDFDPRKRSRR
jgi:hypothetical protein